MKDERENKPSASIICQMSKCSGYWNMIKKYKQYNELVGDNKDGDMGSLGHKAMETDNELILPKEMRWLFHRAKNTEVDLVSEYFDGEVESSREKRMWMLDDNLNPIMSAKLDKMYWQDEKFLIIDYKFGRGDQDKASGNLQLMSQLATVSSNMKVRQARMVIIQPWLGKYPETCDYIHSDMDIVRSTIQEILDRSNSDDITYTPGKQCDYCPGVHVCPGILNGYSIIKDALLKPFDEIPKDKISELFILSNAIAKQIPKFHDWIRGACNSGVNLPRISCEKGSVRRSLPDAEAVYEVLRSECDVSYDDVLPLCSISNSALSKIIQSKTGINGSELNKYIEENFGHLMKKTQVSDKIVVSKDDE